MTETTESNRARDFSLVQGGPLFQLFVRSRLSTDALGWLKRRILFLILLTWLPLLILSLLSGQATGSGVRVSFLYDLEMHMRFLVALPLLLQAEWVIHNRLRPVVAQFIERGIITPQNRARFDACIQSALRWRNSLLIEIALVVLVFTLGHRFFFEQNTLNTSIWYAIGATAELQLSPAGVWLAYISLPVYQFIFLRWLFRICVWAWFLWAVSRLDLYLVSTHPDKAGGLGFLGQSAVAFMPFLLAQGALLSAMIAERILYQGSELMAFKQEIAAFIVFLLILVLGPLSVFAPKLAQVKRQGLLSYGALASRYVREFDNKWLRGGADSEESFIGSADIQSLADLNNSFEVVKSMQILPFGRQTVIQLALVVLLPLLPLLLTIISLEELVKRLVSILL
ncbi:hypothetical protein NP590_00575 [Methylomonas sp. SURF-2]|uniref:ABC transmembrane type-1 domain-containing protein n=1 Tax=Methylomonas subterranea TaxID=2952225 RepID=A0ABT1TAT8_9GAMM|nr:hypothetical protein [Methylomonas sp. SURF-2]MCQ8102580.1 hypothetical protein [Methylomonas sp. SURF-2]